GEMSTLARGSSAVGEVPAALVLGSATGVAWRDAAAVALGTGLGPAAATATTGVAGVGGGTHPARNISATNGPLDHTSARVRRAAIDLCNPDIEQAPEWKRSPMQVRA